MPNIGYGSNKKTRHMLPNGFFKFTVSNVKVGSLIHLTVVGTCIVKLSVFKRFQNINSSY